MQLPLVALALLGASGASVESQTLDLRLDPARHRASATARFEVEGAGPLRFRLNEKADVRAVLSAGRELPVEREGDGLVVDVDDRDETLQIRVEAVYSEDIERGERPGEIHNFSVNAHVGEEGVFLAEASAWHPQWIGSDGIPQLVPTKINIRELQGWAFVASGDPNPRRGATGLSDPVWSWTTPRPVAGVAVAGNRHEIRGVVHETAHGPVEIVMHVSEEHSGPAPLFLDAARAYLDLYVPLLGPFPYRRFSIVENFFSSGFALPGFTLFGPQVIARASHSLAPGYLDHEILHNWWGNGVYVDHDDGNWCEALTTYGANYYRRVAEGGEDAGRTYRRGILMRLSSDPERLDDGPLGEWGRAADSRINRFVGYEKGAFLFMMLERGLTDTEGTSNRSRLWLALKRFASEHMGKRANWDDLREAIEREFGVSLEAFFRKWVREHDVPITPRETDAATIRAFYRRHRVERLLDVASGADSLGPWKEVDPNFWVYRALPPDQIIPTIAGTFGAGGLVVETRSVRDDVKEFVGALRERGDGENLLLIGHAAILAKQDLIERCPNPIAVRADSFELDGRLYDDPSQAVLHSMPHPDRPGRFITVFHSNGEAGWKRLRLLRFYSRDTSVVWQGGEVIAREIFEPSRRIYERHSGSSELGTAPSRPGDAREPTRPADPR